MTKMDKLNDAYKNNVDFQTYVDKYANKCTSGNIEMALTHELVYQAYLLYTKEKQ